MIVLSKDDDNIPPLLRILIRLLSTKFLFSSNEANIIVAYAENEDFFTVVGVKANLPRHLSSTAPDCRYPLALDVLFSPVDKCRLRSPPPANDFTITSVSGGPGSSPPLSPHYYYQSTEHGHRCRFCRYTRSMGPSISRIGRGEDGGARP